MLRNVFTWLSNQPEGVLNLLGVLLAAGLTALGTVAWAFVRWQYRRRLEPSREEMAANDSRRPWIRIVERGIDEGTGRIRLVFANVGPTPAFDVTVRSWCDLSRSSYDETVRVRQKWWQLWLPSRKAVDKEYGDLTENMLAGIEHSGRDVASHSSRAAELSPGQKLVHVLQDDSATLVSQRNLSPKDYQVHLAGEVTYTDRAGHLKPRFPFCFHQSRLVLEGREVRMFYECLDRRRNGSR